MTIVDGLVVDLSPHQESLYRKVREEADEELFAGASRT